MIASTADGVVLTIHAQPGAARTEFAWRYGDALKFRVAASPVKGKANVALCEHLAALLAVPPSFVSVLAGHTGRKKRLKVVGVKLSHVCEKLSVESGCSDWSLDAMNRGKG